ncbi:MAG: hypothetical protein VX438_17830 [Planctomycetota bacterium]|nr:hypothetical protein [Planctomycetota bacterium]
MDEVNELDDWDESTTLDCPNCGEQVYEDAEQCPLCQQYIVPGLDHQSGSKKLSIGTKIIIYLVIASLVLPAVISLIDRIW